MTISYSFDDNDIKSDEPLGSVTIAEGEARLVAETVYLDDFFSALITAFIRSAAERLVSMEIPLFNLLRDRTILQTGSCNKH